MADEEHQEMLAKIGEISGKINRHKSGQGPAHQTQYQASYGGYPYPSRGYRGSRGNTRGAFRSVSRGRGGRPQSFRHRSLVFNADGTPMTTASTSINENVPPQTEANTGYVTKPGLATLQLIKADVFEKGQEQTRKQRLKLKEQREQARMEKEMQRLGSHEVIVKDIRFRVTKWGNKLTRLPGEISIKSIGLLGPVIDLQWTDTSNTSKDTPKTATIAGVRFHRSRNGHMYRDSTLKLFRINQNSSMPAKKSSKPCKTFSNTGSCSKGPDCLFVHDPSKVAVCKDFVHKGSCPSGDSCDLSHELTPERTPSCLHFTRGHCSNPTCRYTHVRVSPTALVCRPFGTYGYCEKGASCTERHVHECPDFSNTGKCSIKGCKLPHRHKASVMRTNAARSDESSEDNKDDISSDEEGFESEDIDSDEVEEFFGDDDGEIDESIPKQQDYVSIGH